MALLFTEGFDYFSLNDLYKKWNIIALRGEGTISSGYSRNSIGKGFRATYEKNILRQNFSGQYKDYTMTVGYACRFESFDDNSYAQYVSFGDSTYGDQCSIRLYPYTQQLLLYRGGPMNVLVSSVNGVYNPYSWNYFEFKAFKNATSGYMEGRVNGITVARFDGNTQNNNTLPFDYVFWNNFYNNPIVWYDDFYICNSSGSRNNSFLGNIQVVTLYPNAAGDSSTFTPSGESNNYRNVNELTLNTTSGFNYGTGVGIEDLYHLNELPSLLTNVKAVVVNAMLNKSGTSDIYVQPEIRPTITTYTSGAPWVLAQSTLQNYQRVFEFNPDTSGDWTNNDITGLQIGIKLTDTP